MGLTIVQNDVQEKNMCGIWANMSILPILVSGEIRNWGMYSNDRSAEDDYGTVVSLATWAR